MTDITPTQIYGNETIECFKFDQAEFETLLDRKVSMYNRFSQGLHYQDVAAHIDFVRHMPLHLALSDMEATIREGYSISKAEASGLYFKAILKKPAAMIEAELVTLETETKAQYEEDRYNRNVAETARLIKETIANKRIEAETVAAAARAKQAAKQEASEEQKALADLLKAHAKLAEVAA